MAKSRKKHKIKESPQEKKIAPPKIEPGGKRSGWFVIITAAARFVFRHYPLDKACNRRLSSNLHPGACLLAEGSACANEQNRFWEFHDIAFETKGKISQAVLTNMKIMP